MQDNHSILKSFVVIILAAVAIFFVWKFGKGTETKSISDMNKTQTSSSSALCPFTLAKDDVFEVVLDDCTQAYMPNGKTVAPDGYVAGKIEIKKLDGTLVRTFTMEHMFSSSEAGTITARINHDASGQYVFLDQGTWTVRSIEIFSLSDGRHFSGNYMQGLTTKNGFFIYNSDGGFAGAHPNVDQSNATSVVSLRLSDFHQETLYTGTKVLDYHLNLDGLINNDTIVPQFSGDTVTVDTYVWSNDVEEQGDQIKVPIINLLK